MKQLPASTCRCFRASFSTLRRHQYAAASPNTHTLSNSISDCEGLRPLAYGCRARSSSEHFGRSEWLSGIVCGFDLAKPTMLMAELHDQSRMNFSRDVLTLNVGLQHEFTENCILIVSMGTSFGRLISRPRLSAISVCNSFIE